MNELLELAGTARERGRAHGESLREEIDDRISRALGNVSEDDIAPWWRATQAAMPTIAGELIGIAEGANTQLAAIIQINVFEAVDFAKQAHVDFCESSLLNCDGSLDPVILSGWLIVREPSPSASKPSTGKKEAHMDTVSFTALKDGTAEEHQLIMSCEEECAKSLPDRILEVLAGLANSFGGFRVTRLEHSLQAATRAHRDGRDEEYVVAALIHDIGDGLAPHTHGEMTAAIMSPYFSPRLCWIVNHHPAFQQFYYGHHTGHDRFARDTWKDHEWFADCVEFCELYDQNCFDPDYQSLPVEFFEPMVRRVFNEPRYLADR